MCRLIVANRNYSSWSLRAWLYLTESGVPFEEIRIPIFTERWEKEILRYNPAGRAPVLLDGDVTVWDSAAIIEYVRRRHPEAIGWPDDEVAQAHALSISYEMHSGFMALRDELPQNIRARNPLDPNRLSPACRAQIERIDEIWSDCREKYGASGEWLFGAFSIADVMYAPVALRFVTYSIPVSARAQEFVKAISDLKSVRDWARCAAAEEETLDFIDELIPAAESPLTPG